MNKKPTDINLMPLLALSDFLRKDVDRALRDHRRADLADLMQVLLDDATAQYSGEGAVLAVKANKTFAGAPRSQDFTPVDEARLMSLLPEVRSVLNQAPTGSLTEMIDVVTRGMGLNPASGAAGGARLQAPAL